MCIEIVERRLQIDQGSDYMASRPSPGFSSHPGRPSELPHESLAPVAVALSTLTQELQNMSAQIATSRQTSSHDIDRYSKY